MEIFITDTDNKKEIDIKDVDGVLFIDVPVNKSAEDILKVVKLVTTQLCKHSHTVDNSPKHKV